MSRYIDIHTHHPTGEHIEPMAVGIHPWRADVEEFLPSMFDDAVAVGEIGLDFLCAVNRSVQERVFRQQLTMAEERCLPVVLHCVRAFEPMMKMLAEYRLPAVIFHGFIGSWQQAERALLAGYYLSFGPNAFRSPKTMEVLRKLPFDRLFVETDESGRRIEDVYEMVATARGVDVEELKHKVENNYKRIFAQNNE